MNNNNWFERDIREMTTSSKATENFEGLPCKQTTFGKFRALGLKLKQQRFRVGFLRTSSTW